MLSNGPLQVGAVVHAGGPPGLTVFNVTVAAQRTPAALVWLVRTHGVDGHFLDFAASRVAWVSTALRRSRVKAPVDCCLPMLVGTW